MKSPKSRYRAELVYDKAFKGIGNVVSFSSDNMEQLKSYINWQADIHACHVTIWENMAKYPEFDWKQIESYNLNK